jgi:hypothetical protein
MPVENFITLDPYLEGVQLALFALQEAGLIPNLDPLAYIFSAFDGKPKLEDTELAALRLQASPWWPLKALGTNLQIWVRNGVPLSTGIAAYRAQLSEWIRGTIDSLEPIVYGRLDPYSLDHAIWLSMTSEQGDTAIVNLNDTIAQQHAKGPLPAVPGPQPPAEPPPFDSTWNISVDGDELGDGFNTLFGQNTLIYDAILNIRKAVQNPGNDQCCKNVVMAISNVVGQLTIIAGAMAGTATTTPTLDFAPVTGAIAELAKAVNAYPPALSACCAAVNTSLGGIKDAIVNAPKADTKGIVDAINAFAKIVDVKPATVKYLVDQGYLDPGLAQVVQSADFGDWLVGALRTWGWTAYQWVLKTVGAGVPGIKVVLGQLSGSIAEVVSTAVNVSLNVGAAPMYPEIKGIIDGVVLQLQPTSLPAIGDVKVDPDLLLAKTLAPILIINGVTLLADYFGWEISEQLKEYVTLASEFVGLQEVRELKVGQMMRFGPMRQAELRAKATYRQEIAGMGAMATWSARGLYDPARARGLAPVLGIPIEQVEPAMLAAQHGLGARRMMTLINTGLFTVADIQEELTFSGIRPLSAARLLQAAPYLATQPERNSLRATLEKVYVAGLYSDAELQAQVDSIEQNTNRDALILQRSRLEKLIAGAKDLEAEYTTLYLGQIIDDPAYRSNLQGIGLQPDSINFLAAKAEARLNSTLHRKDIAAAAALQRATAAEERKAAMKNFTTGNIDLPALAIALIATGLTAPQAAAWTDLAALQKAGSLRWLYGLQLPAAEATLLRQRVAALSDQRKRQQISDAVFVAALQSLKIPPDVINALQATADALLTPKAQAFAIPIQTG